MKIRQWLGYNEDASKYLLRPGELQILNNLQSRRPGMLTGRKGIKKFYGRYNNERILSAFRNANMLGESSDLILFTRGLVEKELTQNELLDKQFPFKFVYQLRRVLKDEDRILDLLDVAPNGTDIENVCIAEDRHGTLYIIYGHGVVPKIYDTTVISNPMLPMGIAPPLVQPQIIPKGDGFFVENVKIDFGGGSYNEPPELTLSGGQPTRPAKLKAIMQNGLVVGADIIDGGADYQKPPSIEVDGSNIGSGFRAKGQPTGASTVVQGFHDRDPGQITGGDLSLTQTYGSKDSTKDQEILYKSNRSVVESTLVDRRCYVTESMPATIHQTDIPVTNTQGISAGDFVFWRYYRKTDQAFLGKSEYFPIESVNHTAGTIRLTYTATNGTSIAGGFTTAYHWQLNFATNNLAVKDASIFKVGDVVNISPVANVISGETPTKNGTPDYPTANNNSIAAMVDSSDFTIQAVDTVNNVITGNVLFRTDNLGSHDRTYTAASTTATTAGFASGRPESSEQRVLRTVGGLQVQAAKATYNSERRRYTASIPLSTTKATGSGAFARLEFSPVPLGKKLDTATSPSSSVTATDNVFQQYNRVALGRGAQAQVTGFRDFLYGEYWQGSEYNRRGSGENATYGGLQASGSRLVKGFTGAIQGGRQADVYWPDYSHISIYFNTGVNSPNLGQWTREDVAVQTVTDANTNVTSKFVEFKLKPQATAKKATSFSGSTRQTTLEVPDELPETVAPTIRINLTECPDSWIVDGAESLPFHVKEQQGNRLAWFSNSTQMERPVVDIPRDANGDITAGSVTITDGGSGWATNTTFQIRLYQANAYYQRNDFNTASSPAFIKGGHPASTGGYAQFKFVANTPDANTPHGPPHTLVQPCLVSNPGSGYVSTDQGTVQLCQREIESDISTAVNSNLITWNARRLATLSGSSTLSIGNIQILSGGSNYFVAPQILVRGGKGGYGLKVLPKLSDSGRIDNVEIVDAGLGYGSDPELYTESRPAMLSAKMRPAMRGRYRCAYRFVDRRQTIIDTVQVVGSNEDLSKTPTTLNVTSTEELEPGMLLEHDSLPHNAMIVSVHGDTQIEINQDHNLLNLEIRCEFLRVFQTTQVTDPITNITTTVNVLVNGNPVVLYATLVVTDVSRIKVGQAIRGTGFSQTATVHSISGNTIRISEDPTTLVHGVFYNLRFKEILEDVILRDLRNPVTYSDLSPIADVDAGPNETRTHSSEMTWNLSGVSPPERADKVELWRTSSDQSLVFYRVEAYGVPSLDGVQIIGTDTLTDEELFDADRPHYAALPVVLPNGSVNAYRFGQPRKDLSVAVSFQDRLWMAVSTSGKDLNTLYYSEFDEFESMPDINELPIQNNQKSTDVLTGLVPFGSMLLAMQHTHTYALTYNTDPGLDASIQLLTHRGVLHQKCWDIHENVLYAADESGIYAMSRNGEVSDVSLPVRDLFVSEVIDFSKRNTFFLQADPRTHILRFFCTFKNQTSETPPQALCFDIQARTWWTESYPTSMTCGVTGRPNTQTVNTVMFGSDDGNMYQLDADRDHSTQSVTDTLVTNGGRGYREAPPITVPNTVGCKVQGVVSEGQLVDVVIQDSGWYAKQGINLLTEDGFAIADHATQNIQGAEYASIALDIGPPVAGGIQAIAEANFAVNPEVKRFGTVAANESFVRLEPPRVGYPEADSFQGIRTENDQEFITEDGNTGTHGPNYFLACQPAHIRVGMECIGDFIPINSFVSSIDRLDVHLKHPDGTSVKILGGTVRTNQAGTDETYLELGGSRIFVRFIEPAHTHVPFRAVSGFSQQLTEDVDRRAGGQIEKSVTVVYNPTSDDKEIELIERFNGQEEMRANGMRRERGGPGTFVHRQDSASTVLNTNKNASSLGFATGVAQAKFASRATADLTGADQYVQWELYGRPARCDQTDRLNFWLIDTTVRPPLPVTIHSLTIEGVVDGE